MLLILIGLFGQICQKHLYFPEAKLVQDVGINLESLFLADCIHNSIRLLTLFSVLEMHFSPRENEVGELMMPKLISSHAYDEEDKRQIPSIKYKPRQDCKGFESQAVQ